MTMRTAAVVLVVAVTGAGAAARSPGDPGQAASGPGRAVLVTSDSALHLQAWRAGAQPGSLEPAWEARPRSVDPATFASRRAEAILTPRDAPLAIADVTGDGQNDLLAVDAFGLTVYGRSPGYYPFAAVGEMGAPSFAVGDLDGDGAAEIVVQRRTIAGTELGREIEISKVSASGLQSTWKWSIPGMGGPIAIGDVDGDKQPELVSAGDPLLVLTRRAGAAWEVTAELPNIGSAVSALRVADVDRDGKPDIVAAGSGGKVTVYKHRKAGERDLFPVLWQSRLLASEGLTGAGPGGPTVMSSALAIGDVTGDAQPDIVVGSLEMGKLGDKDIRSPRVHVFSFDGQRDFTGVWVSDFLALPSISSLAVGDLDGDAANELVVNGREIYRRDAAAKTFRASAAGCPTCTDGVIGTLGDLAEPAASMRVVPLYWNLPGRQLAEGQTAEVAVTLLNPFAGAKDVTVTVTSANPRLEVKSGELRVPAIGAGSTLTLPPFSVTARAGNDPGALRFEITAAGGYRQSVPASVFVAPPLPTYQPDLGAGLAKAMANARHENRRVLIVWGSNAEQPSRDLIVTMVRTADLSRTLLYEYEIVRAELKGNDAAARKYQAAGATDGLPYLTVLDAQGAVLANYPMRPFKGTGTGAAAWDGRKLNEALTKHKPTYVNAEPLFTAALSQARKEGKTLFLWFNAPW